MPLHCMCLVLVILYGACINTKYKSLSKVTDLLPVEGREKKKKVSSDGLVGCLFRKEVTFVKQIPQHDTSYVGEIITVLSENSA